MSASPAVIFEEELSIPAGVADLARFRQWTADESFPERGRIDYLQGTVEVDLSPEDLYTHGVVKTAIASELHQLIAKAGRGSVFVDRTRVVSPAAGLSVEPDVVVVLWDSLRQGRIREVPAAVRLTNLIMPNSIMPFGIIPCRDGSGPRSVHQRGRFSGGTRCRRGENAPAKLTTGCRSLRRPSESSTRRRILRRASESSTGQRSLRRAAEA